MTKQSMSTRKHADVPRKSSLEGGGGVGGGGQEATTPRCVQNPSWYFPSRTRNTNSVSPGFKRYSSFLVFEIFGGKLASESSSSWPLLGLVPNALPRTLQAPSAGSAQLLRQSALLFPLGLHTGFLPRALFPTPPLQIFWEPPLFP